MPRAYTDYQPTATGGHSRQDGTPNPNYTNIFYGGTYNPKKALHISVIKNTTTNIGASLIPLGGTVTGTVTDSTANQPAWPLVVQAQIPKDLTYNAMSIPRFPGLLGCGDDDCR